MQNKLILLFNSRYFRWFAWLVLPLFVYILILVNRFPYPTRTIALAIRYSLTLVFPGLFLCWMVVFRLPGWWGRLIGFITTLAIFSFSLAGLWAKMQSEYYVMSGLIPFVEASSYYSEARRLVEGFYLTDFASWRPLFPMFLAPIVALTGQNIQWIVAILVLTTAASCYLLASEIQRTHGATVAAFTLTVLFLYYRWMGGAIIAENLGISLGVLGFALLWRGGHDRRLFLALVGVCVMTLGLLTRMGAFFVCVVVIVWLAWVFKSTERWNWRASAQGILAILIGLGIYYSSAVVLSRNETPKTPYDYYSTVLYDLASGFPTKYGQIKIDHPELNDLSEDVRVLNVYQLAWNQFIQYPEKSWQGALKQWELFFVHSWYAVYGFLITGTPLITQIIYWGMYVLCVLGCVAWISRRNDPGLVLVLACVLAIILSVPFVPPQLYNRIRLFAATIVPLAVLPALGVDWLLSKIHWRYLKDSSTISFATWITPSFSIFLVFLMLAGTVTVMLFRQKTPLADIPCEGQQKGVYVRLTEGSRINVIPENIFLIDWLPNVHTGKFKTYLHYMPHYEAITELEKRLAPPATIINGLDLKTGEEMVIVGESYWFPDYPALLGVCGQWSDNPQVAPYKMFYAESVKVFSNK